MASSSLATSPFLPSLHVPSPIKRVSVRAPVRRLPFATSAAPSGAAAAARERRRFLERYGLNPDDFEDEEEADPRVCLNDLGFPRNELLGGSVCFEWGFYCRKRGGEIGGGGRGPEEGRRQRKSRLVQLREWSLGRLTNCFRFEQ